MEIENQFSTDMILKFNHQLPFLWWYQITPALLPFMLPPVSNTENWKLMERTGTGKIKKKFCSCWIPSTQQSGLKIPGRDCREKYNDFLFFFLGWSRGYHGKVGAASLLARVWGYLSYTWISPWKMGLCTPGSKRWVCVLTSSLTRFLSCVVCCSPYHSFQDISCNDLLGLLLKNILSRKLQQVKYSSCYQMWVQGIQQEEDWY